MSTLEQAKAMYSDDGEPALPYERWSELAPRLLGRSQEERAALLTREGIDAVDWARADGFWTLTLAAECACGNRARAEAFGRACADALTTRERPSAEAEETLPEGTPPEPPADSAADASPAPAPRLEVPSFLRDASVSLATSERPVEPPLAVVVAPATMATGRPPMTTELSPFSVAAGRRPLPFQARPPGSPPSLLPAASTSARSPAQSGATVDLTHVPLPDPPAPPPSDPSPIEGRDRRTDTGTVELDAALLAALYARGPKA